jgi:xanthine dehydrogenase YagR molybdenum-binding subunit
VNSDRAVDHVAAHADIGEIRALWVDEFDRHFCPTGAKGIGEIGIVGVPAAIGNAIYNATGQSLRDLPFTPDKLLEGG